MRKQKGADKKKFEFLHQKIVIPFKEKCIAVYGGRPEPQPQDNIAKFWLDRDTSQVKRALCKHSLQLFSDHGITVNKHGAARTASEQANDKMKTFNIDKRLNKVTTAEHISSEYHLLKLRIETTFDLYKKQGRLCIKKEGAVVDFLAKLPKNLLKSCDRDVVVQGCIDNGLLDPTKKRIPVLQKMLAGCRRPPTPEELQLVVRTFKPLLAYTMNNGM